MKKNTVLIAISCVFFSLSGYAQFKITENGNVGINTSQPAYKLDINSMETRSFYSGRNALFINHNGFDPRFCSNDRIIFYKTDGTGFANIEFQSCFQAADGDAMENLFSLENKGIETISKLRGLSFNFKNDKLKKKESGFMAQELELVIPEAVFTNDSTEIKSINYNSVMAYMVEAIKEQQSQIDDLISTILELEAIIRNSNLISGFLPMLKNNCSTTKLARLDQNVPNPFSQETRISCFIPDSAFTSFLYVCNINGIQFKTYQISGKGNQVVIIEGSRFIPGTYLYSLVVDGEIVDTRKMLLTK